MFSRGFCLFLGIFVYPIVLLCAVYTVGGVNGIQSMLFWLGFLFVFYSGFTLADFLFLLLEYRISA